MNNIETLLNAETLHEMDSKSALSVIKLRFNRLQKVKEVSSSVTSSGDETSSRIVSDEEIEKKKLEAHYGFMAKIQEVDQNAAENVLYERAALANLLLNLSLD
ncbi:hypothetical protein Tco_1394193 [Tanacetum coccineum]